ncbi:WD40 repeat-like protein [Rhizopogon salebrosus TDB-379]|nr:WD40 repeat-like protein [Rhizopogon salebrosus TDB-379]
MAEEPARRVIQSSIPVREFDHLGEVTAVAVFPDRRRMATNSSDGVLRVWDLTNGVILKELEGFGDTMQDIALSPDGQLIASSDESGFIMAWHSETGRALAPTFRAHASTIWSMDFSPDGAMLATGSSDCMVKLWNTTTWLRGQSIGCNHSVNCVRYSPSGKLLAIATTCTIDIRRTVAQDRIAQFCVPSVSLVWTPDSTRLLSGDRDDATIQEWDSLTWNKIGQIWKGHTGHQWRMAMNCDGTIVASPTKHNHIRLWRLSDRQTIAIFQHSDSPRCVTFSMDGKYILAGGNDKKVSKWAVPEHAWPEDASKDQEIQQTQDCDTKAQASDTKSQESDVDAHYFESKMLAMNTVVRNACIDGDLPTAEELLTQEIDANGNNYHSYANRSVVMARKLDWDRALDDATKSLSIRPSLMGYISKGIALCGKTQVRDAKQAFDLASVFTDGDPKTYHIIFLIKSIALFSANRHAEAIRRIRDLAAACSDADTTLACRVIEVYLRIQMGNSALDRACPAEAADHFTTAVTTGTFLSKSAIDFRYEEFVIVLFGFDLKSLWQTANQKRCHALLRAGRLTEVFDAYRYMTDMSDETTKASTCLDWSLGFIQELTTFQANAPNADATPDIFKYDDENDSISDIDSDIDRVDDVVC